jgi:uncharacterized phiE125 gp8 family phage protein
MRVEVLSPPANEPVTVADLRAYARLDAEGEDDLLARFVAAARMAAETFTGLALVARTVEITAEWPACGALALPVWPVAVSEVRAVDRAGATAVIDPVAWRPGDARPATLLLPARPGAAAVAVVATAGFGPAAAVPETLRLAVLALAAHFYDRRHDDDAGGTLPPAARRLLAPWRRARL